MLLEASIDLDRVPEEYVISAAYDPKLQVGLSNRGVCLCLRFMYVCVRARAG
jgi:hypothetical protein